MPTVSIIVCAYNEGENIGPVVSALRKYFGWCEIVVVDDGSTDTTYEVARTLLPETTVRHHKNRGQGASIKTGIRHATGDFVVLVDGDGQHPIEAIRDVINLLVEKPDIDAVLTQRDNLYSSGHLRSIGKIIINYVSKRLTGEEIRDNNCGLRAFKRSKILPFLFQLPDRFSFSTTSTVLAYKEDFAISWVNIFMLKRTNGTSRVSIRDGFGTLILVFRLIVLFDPLKFFIPLSVYSFFMGLASIALSLLTSGTIGKNYIFFFLFSSLAFILGLLSEQITNLRKEIVNLKHDR